MVPFSSFQTFKSGSISFRSAGSGTPVVLLHGFPEDGALWRDVAPQLAADCTVLIPDLPGAGDSDGTGKAALTMESMADAVVKGLQLRGHDSAVIVGHSMGGYVGLAIAERHPEFLQGLALVHSTATADSDEKKDQRRKTARLLRGGGKSLFVKASIEGLFAPAFKEAHPGIVSEQVERGLAIDEEALAQYTEAMSVRPDRRALLSDCKKPIQWIVGDCDSLLPVDLLMQQVPLPSVSFLVLYRGCGHLSPLEAPDRLAADLSRFVAYCSRSGKPD
jgi:pimeloyl-ACP methyl ester carboxylesterase